MDLSIIIISYNSKELTLKCLDSLMQSNDRLKREIIIIDNASTDGSISAVSAKYKEVKCVVNADNIGFGPANNQAAALAKGRYLLFLNSDTQVYPDTLADLYEAAEMYQADISGCKLVNPDGSIQPQGGSLPNLVRIFDWMFFFDDIPLLNQIIVPYQQRHTGYFRHNQQPGWVGGAAMLVSRDTFNRLGGFDPQIFMYGEDLEFCYRAQNQDLSVHYFAKPQVLHVGQGSGSSKNAVCGEYKGILHLYRKHKPAWQLPLVRYMLKLGALLRIVIFGMILSDATKKDIYKHCYRLA
jgi:GT2 family glycosyltransferase